MKRNPWLMYAVMLFGIGVLSVPLSAAKAKSFELYSWPQEGSANFCYSLLPASKEAPTPEQIKASKDQVCGGSDDLKRILLQAMPVKSAFKWKSDTAHGFVLPERGIVNDLQRFAETIPYKLVVEEK